VQRDARAGPDLDDAAVQVGTRDRGIDDEPHVRSGDGVGASAPPRRRKMHCDRSGRLRSFRSAGALRHRREPTTIERAAMVLPRCS
jgi:hypothetical protein